MGKKRVILPAQYVDLADVKYEPGEIKAPHLTGFALKLFVWLVEVPLIGSFIMSYVKKQNKMFEILRKTKIPEAPMFKPEFPPQEMEPGVVVIEEDIRPTDRVDLALKCLPSYDPARCWTGDSVPFLYWKIRDYAHAYRSRLVTPSMVAENIISVVEELNNKKPLMALFITFSAEEVRKQAAASTRRFEEGNPLSILDGIFMAIKDDIDCCPYPTKGATTWLHEVRTVEKDAVSVSRLRSCGVIFVGKANMHELGLGTTGNNPNYGTTRNPHDVERYTGGSSSGPAAIVASGLCSAALGTDGGGSVRIPSSLCGVVGLKSTYGRTDMKGALCDSGTVEIIGPIASTVEDVMLVYAAISGSSPADRISLKPNFTSLEMESPEGKNSTNTLKSGASSCTLGTSPHELNIHVLGDILNVWLDAVLSVFAFRRAGITSLCTLVNVQKLFINFILNESPPCLPNLSSYDSSFSLGSLRLGKYTEWFNDVYSTNISNKCSDVLNLLSTIHGCEIIDIVIPEIHEMRTAHVVSIGSESLCSLTPDCEDGKGTKLTHDTRTNLALFRSFSASDYVAAQCLRRRMMYYHLEIFKKVDIIVTPTTGMTAPMIPPSSLSYGESNLHVSGYLMRFVIAANLLGLPAISVPVGHDKQGLPVGLQLIGRPWGEASILRLASAVEELSEKSRKKPAIFYDILKK